MQFDPNNKVVKLCAEGMQAEAEGNIEQAHNLFQEAWDIAENDFEAFTAAHYLARNQKNPEDVLQWNIEALERAKKIPGDAVNGSFPSLYLNIGKSYEQLNNLAAANIHYQYDYILATNPQRIIFNPGTENSQLRRMANERGIKTEYACTLVMLSIGQY